MAKIVKYQHIANKKRIGECTKEAWDKGVKRSNYLTYFKVLDIYEKPDNTPAEALEAKAAGKAKKEVKELETQIDNTQNNVVNE